jgi:hypothetical protein
VKRDPPRRLPTSYFLKLFDVCSWTTKKNAVATECANLVCVATSVWEMRKIG